MLEILALKTTPVLSVAIMVLVVSETEEVKEIAVVRLPLDIDEAVLMAFILISAVKFEFRTVANEFNVPPNGISVVILADVELLTEMDDARDAEPPLVVRLALLEQTI